MDPAKSNPVVIDVETSYMARSGSGFSLGHPIVWLGITLGLLLLGYIWLSVYAGSSADSSGAAVKKLAPEQAPVNIVTNPVRKEAEMNITRANDSQRAEEYLEIESVEQQILPLLDAADVQFESEQYVSPPGNNAWESYQAILQIVPDESVAISGKTKVKSKLIANAESAIDTGEYAEAENWLVQLDLIQPDESFQTELRAEIVQLIAADAERKDREQKEEEKQLKIETSLSQAAEELATDSPNYNKVRDLFARVAELDPENSKAEAGLVNLSDKLLDDTENALREEKLETAQLNLKDAIAVYPENKRISALQLALDASVKRQEEAERVAEIELKRKQQQAAADAAKVAENKAVSSPELSDEKINKPVEKKSNEPAEVSTALTNEINDQPATIASGIIGDTPKIATGIIGLDKSAQPTPKQNNPSLNEGIRAYYDGNYAKSFELLYPLAQDDVPRAQFRIGIMYQFGRSVARNTDLAEKWFTAALPQLLRQAQQGAAWAQTDLGTAYEFGISLQQDYERAAYWYQKAADQGYAGAQTNLGVLYAQGDGVPYSRSKAIEWLRKAAAQGDRVANENLGILGVN